MATETENTEEKNDNDNIVQQFYENIDQENENIAEETVSKSSRSSKTTLPKAKKKKTDDFENRILNILETEEIPHEKKKINPHMSFFESILPSVENFDEDNTFEFRIEVMNLIRSIKNKMLLLNQYQLFMVCYTIISRLNLNLLFQIYSQAQLNLKLLFKIT